MIDFIMQYVIEPFHSLTAEQLFSVFCVVMYFVVMEFILHLANTLLRFAFDLYAKKKGDKKENGR